MSTPSQNTQQDSVSDKSAASIQSAHREAASQPQTADGSTKQGRTGYDRIIEAWKSLDPKPEIPPEETIQSEMTIHSFMYPSPKEGQEEEEEQKGEGMSQVYASHASLFEGKTAATLERGIMTHKTTSFKSFEPFIPTETPSKKRKR